MLDPDARSGACEALVGHGGEIGHRSDDVKQNAWGREREEKKRELPRPYGRSLLHMRARSHLASSCAGELLVEIGSVRVDKYDKAGTPPAQGGEKADTCGTIEPSKALRRGAYHSTVRGSISVIWNRHRGK